MAPDSPVNVSHLPVKLKVLGSGPSRVPPSGDEIEAVAPLSRGADLEVEHVEVARYPFLVTDLGITILPS
ncbi:hypothetical protein C3469_18165 [Mycobacterium kansasii]|uniref:Uncharacterized protein n=1 Tax=Mycobacterium kansasii TaxID=1768 RepID=A0A1V3Y0S1_MYCKA|nr:hypothetical protein I547_0373 [Mycobacterium kansasii 824]KEP43042.1 hypothetical protein MKSMC1_18340 [Mycobacterium kansasii]MXO35732.1 hypothetical protein [Mycobacterium kansasii]OOK82447.1 hypothetical protein BZL30_0775 [Mycobacterium kansasii]OOK84341.1 hypothetical protein BZL29_1088 [Mycobacterium kansasii]